MIILLRIRNVSDENCRVNQYTNFMFNTNFPKSRGLWGKVKKCGTARQATGDVIIRRMRFFRAGLQRQEYRNIQIIFNTFFRYGSTAPSGPGPPHYRDLTITPRHTTVGRTPLDEWSARDRDRYLTAHNTHKCQTSMPSEEFEPAIPANQLPQTHAVDQCFSTAGPRPGTGPWHQLYRAARGLRNLQYATRNH